MIAMRKHNAAVVWAGEGWRDETEKQYSEQAMECAEMDGIFDSNSSFD